MSTSLPDLDRSSDDASEYSERSKASTSKIKDKQRDTSAESTASKISTKKSTAPDIKSIIDKLSSDKTLQTIAIDRQSIIDVLHQRVFRPANKLKKNQKLLNYNEPKLIPQTKETELLSTPGVDNNDAIFGKKKLFDTIVLKSRTRTENQVQKTKEIIREVFGGDDRPASAPPLSCEVTSENESLECLTFDQKYAKFLEKMNIDFSDKFKKVEATKIETKPTIPYGNVEIKLERMDVEDDETQDTEINAIERTDFVIKEEAIEKEECDTPSVISERDGLTPTGYRLLVKKKKGNRAGRRKGSSGFDYIRKKKKPPPANASAADLIALSLKKRIITYVEPANKDENDISREVKGWVLNKGVGESILHKASRLGYIVRIIFILLFILIQ